MSKAKTAKERVQEVYPDAVAKYYWKCTYVGNKKLWYIHSYYGDFITEQNHPDWGDYPSESEAWQSALTRITNNKTKSND